MQVQLILDYATFNFAVGSVDVDSIAETVTGDTDGLRWHKAGLSENSVIVSPFGMSFLANSGFAARPHRLQVSGSGCAHFEPMLTDLRKLAENHISRCDFAFDVIMSRSDWRKYISTVVNESLNNQDRVNKRYTFAGSGEAVTIYIGKRKCAKYCRIYNKSLEDPTYTYKTADGKVITLDKDQDGELIEYIIRYEVEFKRFKSNHQDFNPSYLFDSYFSDFETVKNEVKDVWRLYSEDFLLPCPINELEFTCRSEKIKILYNTRENALTYVNDIKFESPRVFDSTITFVADRFGKYIPFILANDFLRNLVLQKCEAYCGFRLDVIVSCSEAGFYEIDEEKDGEEPQDEMKYQSPAFDQIDILQKGGEQP